MYHIAQRSVVRLFVCLFVCLSVCLRLSVVVVVVTCILCCIKMDRGEKTGREGRKENKNNEKKKRGVRMISPQNASSASELCDEELGGLRVVFINDVWTLLVSLFSLGKMCYSFSSLLFSFFLSNVVVVVVVLFVPYPLTVSEYLELVLLRVVNGTLGE